MAVNVIERIMELDKQRASLLGDAKSEILSVAKNAVAELNALGFAYKLVEEGGRVNSHKTSPGEAISVKMCPVCNFKTDPPHDARAHRGQGKRKRPFTESELKQRGVARAH